MAERRFGNLVALTREYCEKLLEGSSIKGVVQGRVKKPDSLKEKLKVPAENFALITKLHENADDEAHANEADAEPEGAYADIYNEYGEIPNVRDWVRKRENIYKHPEIGDLAGIRIGLYFPDDVKKVALEIEKYFKTKHRWGTVKDGRNATKGRNLDPQSHLTIGAWVSPGPDGADEHWEHYGYKSWQVVVQWKEDLLEPLKSGDPCARLELELPRGRLESLRDQMPKGFKSLRVEFQVGTVVTQAWAEVQHNIIYKNPYDVSTTPTMRRMIDAINGLAITTDIMLKELERSLEDAKKEEEAERIKGQASFINIRDSLEHLGLELLDNKELGGYDDWIRSLKEARQYLCDAGPNHWLSSTDTENLWCRFYTLKNKYLTAKDKELLKRVLSLIRPSV